MSELQASATMMSHRRTISSYHGEIDDIIGPARNCLSHYPLCMSSMAAL
ncbi:MAG: hypothetical protein NG747_12085 [Candidatus Brocadia sp.]|nr:hypothetical protein [Candidatus Brocadia sp.]